MSNQRTQGNSLDDIRAAVAEAIAPLGDRISKLESRFDAQDTRYYPREMVDQMISAIHLDVTGLRDEIKKQSDSVWKLIGGAAVIIGVVVTLAQHVSIR